MGVKLGARYAKETYLFMRRAYKKNTGRDLCHEKTPTSLPFPSIFDQWSPEPTVLRASVDEEDREEEKEDGYAAHGGDEDDSGGWGGESRPENQSGSRDTRVAFRRAVRRSQTHRLPKRELPRQSWSHHRLGEFL